MADEDDVGTHMTDDELLAAADLLPMSTPDLFDDRVRQEIEHVLTREEALGVARRRLALPPPPTEAERLHVDVEQARALVGDLARAHPELVPELRALSERSDFSWLGEHLPGGTSDQPAGSGPR